MTSIGVPDIKTPNQSLQANTPWTLGLPCAEIANWKLEDYLNSSTKYAVLVVFSLLFAGSALNQTKDSAVVDVPALEAKASQGDVAAMVQVARAYTSGNGAPIDMEKGRVWLERAAEKGSIEARMWLGAAYLSGRMLPQNKELAAKYLLPVAEAQDVGADLKGSQALAQYWLSLMYAKGSGVQQSQVKALQLLQLSAENGNPSALFDLASLYNEGTGGLSLDIPHACALFEKAADQGSVKAMHNTGNCYLEGTGGKKDRDKAILYYTKAAEGGSVRSQRNLGLLYGRDGELVKGFFWLRIAELSGDKEVSPLLDKVKAALSATQLENGEKEVDNWIKAHDSQKRQ